MRRTQSCEKINVSCISDLASLPCGGTSYQREIWLSDGALLRIKIVWNVALCVAGWVISDVSKGLVAFVFMSEAL
jgi:hypothetical protein